MSIRITIENKYIDAVKSKHTSEINTFRLIKSAIKDSDIASRSSLKDEGISDKEILSLLQNLIKQRKDSIDSFKLASREDLIIIEQEEINIISEFLPKQIGEKETEELILTILEKNKFESIKDMGKIMNELKTKYAGTLDMALAGKIAKSKLSK